MPRQGFLQKKLVLSPKRLGGVLSGMGRTAQEVNWAGIPANIDLVRWLLNSFSY